MPKNKSTKTDDRQNDSSLREEAETVKSNKMSRRPPSLNNIDKNSRDSVQAYLTSLACRSRLMNASRWRT